MAKTILCRLRCTYLPSLLIYVHALPSETQMLQNSKLLHYAAIPVLPQIAHLCIINSTEGAT